MIQVSDSGERPDVFSETPSGKRFLFALCALIPPLAPYELMLRVQWNDYRSPAFLLAATISAGAVALSMFFLFAVVAGLRACSDDPRRGALDIHLLDGGPIVPHRTLVRPLASLESVPCSDP